MHELLIQLRVKAYNERNALMEKIPEPRDVITNNPDSDVNIINNRFALIFDSINKIEENMKFLETRYGS